MANFARTLESDVDRPVIDMTGLEGTYDIRLEFASAPPIAFAPGSPDPQAPELFTALTEQLGLRLESRRGPVVVLVVDSALRQPTPPGAAVVTPAFEVASVRPNTSSDTRYVTTWSADGRFRSTNITVRRLIELAYNLRSGNRPAGAPGWLASERFDVDAIPAVLVPREQQRLMLQGLLRDRFGLLMREQPVDVPVYALVRTNPDAPLPRAVRESTVKCTYEGLSPAIIEQREARGESLTGDPRCDGVRVLARGRIVSAAGRISTLAGDLGPYVDRRIVDRTGLTGRYDFELTWTSDPLAGKDVLIANAGLFSAIQELGLKLQPTLSREQGYVIERIQRPTPN